MQAESDARWHEIEHCCDKAATRLRRHIEATFDTKSVIYPNGSRPVITASSRKTQLPRGREPHSRTDQSFIFRAKYMLSNPDEDEGLNDITSWKPGSEPSQNSSGVADH